MSSGPMLETQRLRLRPYEAGDFEAYAAIFAEPEVMRHLGGAPLSREAAWTRFLRQIGLWRTHGFGAFAVTLRDDGRLIGTAGFHELKRDLSPSLEGTLEAGWVFAGAAQGRGFAGEAMRAAMAWAGAEHPGLRMTCIVDPENAASLRLAARLGFVRIAQAEYGGRPVAVLERLAATAL